MKTTKAKKATVYALGLLAATFYAVVGTVTATVEEDGSGAAFGIVYCIPGEPCDD